MADQDWDGYFAALDSDKGPQVPGAGVAADPAWESHFSGVASAPAIPQTGGLKRAVEQPFNVFAGETQNLLGLPGTVEALGNKFLPNWMTRPLGTPPGTEPKNFSPTPEDFAKASGLGLPNHPELAPQNALERYTSAAVAALPNAALMPAKAALLIAEAGSLAAQGAKDALPGQAWAPIAAGVIGSMGAAGLTSTVEKVLAGSAASKALDVANSRLADATEAAFNGKQAATTTADSIKTASKAKLLATQDTAQAAVDAIKAQADQTFESTAGLLGRSKTVEDAGKALQDEARVWKAEVMPKKLAAVSEPLDAAVPAGTPTPLSNYAGVLKKLNTDAPSLQGQVDLVSSGLPKQLAKDLAAKSELGELTGTAGAVPTWSDVRKLRTKLGDAMTNPTLIKGVSQQEISALYSALTKDLGAAASQAGAGDLWNNFNTEATRLYGVANGPMSKIISHADATQETLKPGEVAKALLSGAKDDSSDLATLRAEIPGGVNELAAANLRGPKIWSELTPEAKAQLVPPGYGSDKTVVLDQALASQEQAATNAKQLIQAARREHLETVSKARADAQAGKFSLDTTKREAAKARDAAAAAVPSGPNPLVDQLHSLKRWGLAGLGYTEGSNILNHIFNPLGIDVHPAVGAAAGLAMLGAPVVGRGLKNLVRNPASATIPITGAVAGGNALDIGTPPEQQ